MKRTDGDVTSRFPESSVIHVNRSGRRKSLADLGEYDGYYLAIFKQKFHNNFRKVYAAP